MPSATVLIASTLPRAGSRSVATSLALGLTVTAMAYVVAPGFKAVPPSRRATRPPVIPATRRDRR